MSDSADSPTGRLLATSPTEISRLLRGYLAEELLSLDDLRNQITAYLEDLAHRSLEHEFIDLELATKIGQGFIELVNGVNIGISSEHRRLIQAAAKYFVTEEDADPDTASPIGFDDDTLVFNLVAKELGRDDLVIEGF
jgi:hypothetical protein